VRAVTSKLGHARLKWRRDALAREAVAAFGVFVLLLSALAGSLSHSHFEGDRALALSPDGSKIAICSGARMVFADANGNIVPDRNQPQHQDHRCACCLLMQANAVLSPPPAMVAPLELTAIQTLSPGLADPLDAAPVSARRNRDPPFQA
jgi:hypothetical protein